jgi:acetamidase/formamidase
MRSAFGWIPIAKATGIIGQRRTTDMLASRALLVAILVPLLAACAVSEPETDRAADGATSVAVAQTVPEPEFVLDTENTHNRFSRTVPPVLTVPSGAVVEVHTKEASDGQLGPDSDAAALANLDFDPIHPLSGPIYVEGAQPGDVLAVTIHEVELGEWGWVGVAPGFGFLADEFTEPYVETFRFTDGQTSVQFADGRTVPLHPFPGVMGVAPDTDEMLSTIPPRRNGGNMDNKHLQPGTTVYFPVLVEGALFSVGDTHAAQGDGEVCGTAIEAPMRLVLELELRKGGRELPEPQYENAELYATTGFAETLDEAARKATRFMIDYLEAEHGMDRTDAYVLASLAGDLKIAEVVDVPHVLVAMHMPKSVLAGENGDM